MIRCGLKASVETHIVRLADYQIRTACFPVKSSLKGHVVFLHGYAEFIEKYQPFYALLQELGYQVWTFDWPAQGLSERFSDHKKYMQSVLDAPKILHHFLHYLYKRHKVVCPHLIAHSMGGLIAIHYLQDLQNKQFFYEFDQIILSAPFLSIYPLGPAWNFWILQYLRLINLSGRSKVLLNPRSLKTNNKSFKSSKLTSNYHMWMLTKAQLQDNPNLRSNHANYGWIYQIYKFINEIFRRKYDLLPKMTVMKASNEKIVSNTSIDMLFKHQPHVKLIEIQAKHQVLQDITYLKAKKIIEETFNKF